MTTTIGGSHFGKNPWCRLIHCCCPTLTFIHEIGAFTHSTKPSLYAVAYLNAICPLYSAPFCCVLFGFVRVVHQIDLKQVQFTRYRFKNAPKTLEISMPPKTTCLERPPVPLFFFICNIYFYKVFLGVGAGLCLLKVEMRS